jgi:hypothetical protein
MGTPPAHHPLALEHRRLPALKVVDDDPPSLITGDTGQLESEGDQLAVWRGWRPVLPPEAHVFLRDQDCAFVPSQVDGNDMVVPTVVGLQHNLLTVRRPKRTARQLITKFDFIQVRPQTRAYPSGD